jgi:hypothetical protein
LTKDYIDGKYDAIWRLVVPEQMYYLKTKESGMNYNKGQLGQMAKADLKK